MEILVENQKFSRSRMMKMTSPLESSSEIYLLRRILLDSEIIEISLFSRSGVSGDTWQGHGDAT